MKVTPVCDHQTALMDFVVLATSGPKSANQCSIRGKFVPNNARKVPMGWRFSRGVTVQKACPAKFGKMLRTPRKPDSTCARRSDEHWESYREQTVNLCISCIMA